MTVVKVNTITVNNGADAHRLIDRLADRRRDMEGVPGFLGVEVLAPVSHRINDAGNYLVLTRWEAEGAYCAWLAQRDTHDNTTTERASQLQAEVDLDEFDTIDLDRH